MQLPNSAKAVEIRFKGRTAPTGAQGVVAALNAELDLFEAAIRSICDDAFKKESKESIVLIVANWSEIIQGRISLYLDCACAIADYGTLLGRVTESEWHKDEVSQFAQVLIRFIDIGQVSPRLEAIETVKSLTTECINLKQSADLDTKNLRRTAWKPLFEFGVELQKAISGQLGELSGDIALYRLGAEYFSKASRGERLEDAEDYILSGLINNWKLLFAD